MRLANQGELYVPTLRKAGDRVVNFGCRMRVGPTLKKRRPIGRIRPSSPATRNRRTRRSIRMPIRQRQSRGKRARVRGWSRSTASGSFAGRRRRTADRRISTSLRSTFLVGKKLRCPRTGTWKASTRRCSRTSAIRTRRTRRRSAVCGSRWVRIAARSKLPADWKGREVFIHFDGIMSAGYVWINGEMVGYHEDSMTPAEFNITKHHQAGQERSRSRSVSLVRRQLSGRPGYVAAGGDLPRRLSGVAADELYSRFLRSHRFRRPVPRRGTTSECCCA